MSATPQGDAPDWPARFRAAHGRAPRILHIGNIANYAWVNAMLMRRHGVEAVVLDPDFQHFASAPEWIEATIEGGLGDHFAPAWHRMRIAGFVRPEWFLNGPSALVMPELLAREGGQPARRALLRGLSALHRRAMASRAGALRRAAAGAARIGGGVLRRLARRGAAAGGGGAAGGDGRAASALARFDVVIGYALGAEIARQAGHPRFVALELGTLRGLPFEDSATGRTCAALYRAAPEVFVTNLDCIDATQRLGIPQARITAMPHPFDLDRALARAAADAPAAGGDPVLLCPARQHWKRGNASWLKGNDVLIRGAALAATRGAHFRLTMVEWGEEVADSRALIEGLGLGDRVRWIPPAPRATLWPMILRATAVLDQFAAPAIGGVGIETLALGRRLVTRLDPADPAPFFATQPPVLHAATAEQVAARIAQVLADPEDLAGLGARGQDWMRAEHGVARQLALQFAACERLVARFGPAAHG